MRVRKDLYYRINVINLNVPPLREHIEDIPILVEVLLKRLQSEHHDMVHISKEALHTLSSYAFPGNVRELENILERAIALCEGDIIMPVNLHLPSYEQVNDNVIIESLGNTSNVDEALDAKQRDAIISALNKTKWNRTAAAKLLGITFRALRYRIKKFDIE